MYIPHMIICGGIREGQAMTYCIRCWASLSRLQMNLAAQWATLQDMHAQYSNILYGWGPLTFFSFFQRRIHNKLVKNQLITGPPTSYTLFLKRLEFVKNLSTLKFSQDCCLELFLKTNLLKNWYFPVTKIKHYLKLKEAAICYITLLFQISW